MVRLVMAQHLVLWFYVYVGQRASRKLSLRVTQPFRRLLDNTKCPNKLDLALTNRQTFDKRREKFVKTACFNSSEFLFNLTSFSDNVISKFVGIPCTK